MDTSILDEMWKERNRDLNILSDAHKRLQDKRDQRRTMSRTDMSDVGCAVSYEDNLGLLVEFNETNGGAFIMQTKPDIEGRTVPLMFHPHPDHVAKLKSLHAHSGIEKIDDFEEQATITIIRELTDYEIWLCVFEFTEESFSSNSPRRKLFELMKDSLVDRLSDTFL